ncbi:MAG: hypothetical protein RR949_05415 [Oscillospiraceae bacterium]
MKRPGKCEITDAEILAYDNVPVEVAARYIGWCTSTIYYALQDERAPFGFATHTKNGDSWVYNISPGLLVKYKKGDLPTYKLAEVEKSMVDCVDRLLSQRLQQAVGLLMAPTGATL